MEGSVFLNEQGLSVNPDQLPYDARKLGREATHLPAPIKGVVLAQTTRAEKAMGEAVEEYLLTTIKQGLSEEEIARQLSEKSGEKIYTYSIFMLKQSYLLNYIPESQQHTSSGLSRNTELFREAIGKNLIGIEEWGAVQQILFYTQCGGTRMSLERLSQDLGISRIRLSRMSSRMVRDVRVKLGHE